VKIEPRTKNQEPRVKSSNFQIIASAKTYGLDLLIRQVEQQWLQLLYEYVRTEFSKTWLPSHDHTHHLRVWSFARDLAETLHREGCHFSKTNLEQLIIAVFFHDTGLTRTLDASHGKESREICRKFLEEHTSLPAEGSQEILDAVEKHDDKSYPQRISSGKELPDDLLTMLAVCDDMDAFGAIGVYRYLEIYTGRGIQMKSLAVTVIENLERRFSNLKNNYGQLESLIRKQDMRCRYTMNFFRELDEQLRSNPFQTPDQGPLAVVNILLEEVLRKKNHLTVLPQNYGSDEPGKKYFRDLHSELSLYSL